MNELIRFSDEQAMLLETASAFCREKSPIHAVRALLGSDHGYDRGVWEEIVALGWPALAIPENFGGSGLSLAEAAAIAEPMGRHLMAVPFASCQIFVAGVLAGADAALQAAVLPRIAGGAIGTVALFEQEGDWSLTAGEAFGARDGETVVLSGAKTFVCDAAVAGFVLVSFVLDGAPALAVLTEIAPERLRREIVIDETQRGYRLDLDGISVPMSKIMTGTRALAALDAVRDAALLLNAAAAAGGIAGVLDVTVEYLNTRTAFGRKIGSFQSLKHTCAEILVGLERTRSHVWHAASVLGSNQDAEIALRMAKTEAGEVFTFAGDRAVQFHGGFGFTFDCDAQLFLRRALWLEYSFGDGAHHRRWLADLLLA